jgi:hypothetical protein
LAVITVTIRDFSFSPKRTIVIKHSNSILSNGYC